MVRKKAQSQNEIVATSESSRFHNETLDTLSKDVDLRKVSLSAGLKDLLVDTDLRITAGAKYGLVGPNGCGKTTLLKCIGYKKIPGIASNLRTLYVEQVATEGTEQLVLETVVDSDKQRVALSLQLATLEAALEAGNVALVQKAIKYVKVERQREELQAAQKKASERTGTRGHRSRKALVEQEAVLEQLENLSLEDVAGENDETLLAQELVSEISESLEGYDSVEVIRANASKILGGLGFTQKMMDEPAKLLSGGWRIRASLASALLIKPDILLLDEPTNHLDLPTVLWLQRYLQSLDDVLMVVVSHNRAFLNEVAEEIIVVKDQHLDYFTGNYDEYIVDYNDKQSFLQAKADANQKKKDALELSVEKALVAAKRSGDDKKVQTMVSRKKKLDRIGMDVNEKGHRFKLNRDRGGYHENIRDDVVVDKQMVPDVWKVEPPPPLRYQGDLLVMKGVGHKYGDNVIFGRVNLAIGQRARIGIVGANGTGKSTLIHLLTGQLQPTVGTIERPGNASIGTFDQFNAESFRSSVDVEATPLTLFSDKFPASKESQVRGHLGKFGIRGSTAVKPLVSLSGGELARVKLALNFFELSPNLLILDEPTNHLDMLLIESLAELVTNYEGAVVAASHDQHFVDRFAKEIYTFEKKQLKRVGSVDEYVEALQ